MLYKNLDIYISLITEDIYYKLDYNYCIVY